jgi:hypothetical protein
LILTLVACEKRTATQLSSNSQATISPIKKESNQTKVDACALITKEEITATQESPITETKSSFSSNGNSRISQCFYTATVFSKSINLTVTQRDADAPGKHSSKDFWRETFGQSSGEEREQDRDARENEQERPITSPKKVDGIGDEAYWSAAGSALYLLKKDVNYPYQHRRYG